MTLYKAGQEIDAYCTKCKMDLLHRIVAEVKGKPVKVECRTCYSTHLYRAPKRVNSPGAPPQSEGARGVEASATARAAASRKVEQGAPLLPPEGARVLPYRMTERFAPETWLMHKTFGIGQVVRELGPDKIEVRFEDGPRVLVQGRTE